MRLSRSALKERRQCSRATTCREWTMTRREPTEEPAGRQPSSSSRSAGALFEGQVGAHYPAAAPGDLFLALGVKRHLLPPATRILLDDPGREPQIARPTARCSLSSASHWACKGASSTIPVASCCAAYRRGTFLWRRLCASVSTLTFSSASARPITRAVSSRRCICPNKARCAAVGCGQIRSIATALPNLRSTASLNVRISLCRVGLPDKPRY